MTSQDLTIQNDGDSSIIQAEYNTYSYNPIASKKFKGSGQILKKDDVAITRKNVMSLRIVYGGIIYDS